MCTVRLRQKYKNAKCRFFVVSWVGPALLGIPDTEMLSLLRIMCKVISDTHEKQEAQFAGNRSI